jgi:hypothetical protein
LDRKKSFFAGDLPKRTARILMSEDTWYFAYGSNLNIGRKEERTGSIRESHVAKLAGYRLAFNKRGSNGEAYANLLANPTEEVLGVVFGVVGDP